MKKFLLSLLALVAINASAMASAMVEETVTFDFTDPLGITFTPALPPLQDTNGNILSLGNSPQRTATAGPVSILFGVGQGNAGPAIYRYADGSYTLNIRKWSTLTFSVTGGCQLTKIQFVGVNALTVPTGQKGRFNPTGNYWYSYQDTNVQSVMLEQGFSDDSHCPKIIVTYERPATPLNLSSSDPANDSTVSEFKTMKLFFNIGVTSQAQSSNITLTGTRISGSKKMTASLSGSTVTLTAPDSITRDGEFTVTVPANTFFSSEGSSNQEAIQVKFKVVAKRDTFNPIKIEPDSGTVGALPQEIKLTFDNYVQKGTGIVKFTRAGGTESYMANVATEGKVATIINQHPFVEESNWTVEIEEKAFTNEFPSTHEDFRWNAALSLDYKVDGSQDGPQDSETMKEAKQALKLTGVGYPKNTSAAWTALNTLVMASETPADDAIAAALTDLYNETNVTMPTVDSWYKIAGVNANGQRIYLAFNEEQTEIRLATSANNAAAFKVTSVDGNVVVLETKGGLYLHVLTALPMHEGTSSACLTEEKTAINDLTFAKFLASAVEGVAPKALFGMLTMYGSLGKVNGTEESAYAMLDFDNTSVVTYPNTPSAFNASKSNAFVFEETTEPTSGTIVIPSVGLRPDAIHAPGDEMLLVINGTGIRKTTIVKKEQIAFTKNGQKVDFTGDILIPTPTENQFDVNTKGLTKGTYTIEMPEGTFSYDMVSGQTIKDVNLSVEFYIQTDDSGSGSTDVIPTATLSREQMSTSDESQVLTIGNVKKAALTASAAPYFKYADGDKQGDKVPYEDDILTPVSGSDVSFYVNTKSLAHGTYTLVMPKGTFTYLANDASATVIDKEMTADFKIGNEVEPAINFSYTYDAFMVFMPALVNRTDGKIYDVDLNEMVLYVYKYMRTGLEPNPDAKVWIGYSVFGTPVRSGHFVKYTTFAQDYGSEFEDTYALKLVLDVPIESGDFNNFLPGLFNYSCEAATFGDANYGEWLKNHDSVDPSDCIVNPATSLAQFTVSAGSPTPTGITNVNTDNDWNNAVIYDMQGRRVQSMDKKGVYIINGKKVVNK